MANKWARNFLMASLAAGASLSLGQVTIQSSVYQQNFNSLSATGDSNNWTNNVTLEGWYAFRTPSGGSTVAVGAYRASDGNFANGALMSYGQNGSGDRALGTHTTFNTSNGGTYQYGVGFTNGLAQAITGVSISYRGETWKIGDASVLNTIQFQYSLSPNAFTDSGAQWTNFDALSFTQFEGLNGGGYDGNTHALDKQGTLSGLSFAVGTTLWLRWVDIDDQGNDHSLGIDDFEITFHTASSTPVPEPGTMILAGLACAAGIRRRFGKSRG